VENNNWEACVSPACRQAGVKTACLKPT